MFEFEDLFIKMLLEYLIIKNGKVKKQWAKTDSRCV
jgi:hypothetical protein